MLSILSSEIQLLVSLICSVIFLGFISLISVLMFFLSSVNFGLSYLSSSLRYKVRLFEIFIFS